MEIVEVLLTIVMVALLGLGWTLVMLLMSITALGLGRSVGNRAPLLRHLPKCGENSVWESVAFIASMFVTVLGTGLLLRQLIPHAWMQHEPVAILYQMATISIGMPIGGFVTGLFIKE